MKNQGYLLGFCLNKWEDPSFRCYIYPGADVRWAVENTRLELRR